jgi:hypothetical protein
MVRSIIFLPSQRVCAVESESNIEHRLLGLGCLGTPPATFDIPDARYLLYLLLELSLFLLKALHHL